MLKAKLDSARKNKKGFSLVELIIVMAIMVALVAVMAPQFIKYVQRSRDSVVSDAAENILSCVKTEIALGHIKYNTTDTSSTITIKTNSDGKVDVSETGVELQDADYGTEFVDGFVKGFCGVDTNKSTKTAVSYQITIDYNGVASMKQLTDSKGSTL